MHIRLFLTSMLAVAAVCPAFADPVIGPNQNEANCSSPTIGDAEPGDTVNYVADWSPLECEITLDSNLANGAATQSSLTLYARYADGAYRSLTDRTNSSNKMTTNAYGLETTPGNLTLPTGATVTTTYTAHLPGSHTLFEVDSWPVTAPATTKSGSRALKGYYSAPTNGTAYIGGTSPYTPYYITTAGNTEAPSIVADPNGDGTTCTPTTWFAQWDCVDSPLPNLTLTGYTFDGWYTDFAYETSATGTCVVADRTVHAKWTAYTGTVTYTCGTGATGTISATTALEYDQPFSLEGKSIVDANCTKNGYTFTGWSCAHTVATGVAGTTVYAWANNAVTNGSGTYAATTNNLTITCDAQWNADPVYLEWYDGEDEVSGGQPTCEWNVGSITTIPHPTKTGYTFKGWNIQQ